jgi:hypothetical protein
MASTLLPELVEEILLRIPPDEPAHLVHAALVCKAWRRIVSDRGFLRRYRGFHGPPPLLGYIDSLYNFKGEIPTARFIPTTTTACPVSAPAIDCSWSALDSHHGRVLIRTCTPAGGTTTPLVVWDSITRGQRHLSMPPYHCGSGYTGAVLCAADVCDHLDCHGGPFLVVFVGTTNDTGDGLRTWASVYSSVTGVWSSSTSICTGSRVLRKPNVLIGGALYFSLECGSILKYDLSRHGLSMTSMPRVPNVNAAILMETEDGELGVATLANKSIYVLSQKAGTNNNDIIAGGGQVKQKVIKLEATLLAKCDPLNYIQKVIGFAEGTNKIFIGTNNGAFTLDLKTRRVRKVGEREAYFPIFPYMTFYTPRL